MPNRLLPQLEVTEVAGFLAAQPAAARPAVLLDVREDWELQTARLDLADAPTLHIPMNSLPARLADLPRDRPVLVLCHHGARSLQCVAFLQQQGLHLAYNLTGGIDAWSREVDAAVPRY